MSRLHLRLRLRSLFLFPPVLGFHAPPPPRRVAQLLVAARAGRPLAQPAERDAPAMPARPHRAVGQRVRLPRPDAVRPVQPRAAAHPQHAPGRQVHVGPRPGPPVAELHHHGGPQRQRVQLVAVRAVRVDVRRDARAGRVVLHADLVRVAPLAARPREEPRQPVRERPERHVLVDAKRLVAECVSVVQGSSSPRERRPVEPVGEHVDELDLLLGRQEFRLHG